MDSDKVKAAEDCIVQHFPFSQRAQKYYTELFRGYVNSGLADSHFLEELISKEPGKFEQRAWEMTLARRLGAQGYKLASTDVGPDFCLNYQNKKIWIEAIAPTPRGLPAEWLKPPPRDGSAEAVQVPFDAILLRWTAALKEKWEKLEGRVVIDRARNVEGRENGYRANGIVHDEDAYVIAIDPSQLTACRPLDEGNSRLPFAVEVVFPVGPIGIPISPDGRAGKAVRTVRYSIKNRNRADVPTDSFLNLAYAGVSAVVGGSTIFAPAENLHLTVVHNPLARVQLPTGLFGANTAEWVPEKIGEDEYNLNLRE